MTPVQSHNRLRVWADKILTRWLQQVVELSEPESCIPIGDEHRQVEQRFRVLTPELQRRIDESA